ncbi:uncharacterized protein with NRDE domain [Natronospira proteinivora]|uniref:Uncharacterized protein with NRDE domain n=1 Tax=Natronospira proteinivora TaxID=1807133 RepID=A0ABT1GDC0_9GAMM|nr:NRDE family protein [Natronospira proteinivora]MCP1728258.1 uncharacterized protein with NRDE domain [Natronospira proteinivora]
MCLLAIAWKQHPRLRLMAAGNRDEFHARPTEAAAFWPDRPDLLAGRDRTAGGTWLGLSRQGRFAAVTNVREADAAPGERSRGELTADFLDGGSNLSSYLEQVAVKGDQYAGFNLLLSDGERLGYVSNRDPAGPRILEAGIYAVSNHLLDSPWPKLLRLRHRFERQLNAGRVGAESLYRLLDDREPARPQDLPDTGLPPELERRLSAPFVLGTEYGTRCASLAWLWEDGIAHFRERRFDAGGHIQGESPFRFTWETGEHASK